MSKFWNWLLGRSPEWTAYKWAGRIRMRRWMNGKWEYRSATIAEIEDFLSRDAW